MTTTNKKSVFRVPGLNYRTLLYYQDLYKNWYVDVLAKEESILFCLCKNGEMRKVIQLTNKREDRFKTKEAAEEALTQFLKKHPKHIPDYIAAKMLK